MQGSVERAVRASVTAGQTLYTPSRNAPFVVGGVDSQGIVLLLGRGEWATRLTWECLEGVVPFVASHGGIVDIGGRHDVVGNPGTLDEYLKGCVKRTTAGWVAVVLDTAGVVEIVHSRPGKVRLVQE